MIVNILELPEEQRPPKQPPEYGTADGVLSVLRSMVLMLTTMLQPSVDGVSHANILSLRIRIFLNNLEAFDAPLRRKKIKNFEEKKKVAQQDDGRQVELVQSKQKKRKLLGIKVVNGKPIWLSKFNFLCLLNLPKTVEEFGPARNYFEGKYLGERYVQEVKTA